MTAHPSSRPPRAKPLRPRMWVPGVLYVDLASTVHIGDQAGLAPGEEHIDQWQCEVHLVVKASMDKTMRRAAGVQLPESIIDEVAAPMAHGLARKAKLVAVRESAWSGLVAAGATGFVVSYDRDQGILGIRREEKGRPPFELRRTLAELTTEEIENAVLAKDTDAVESLHEAMLDALVDRLLQWVSDGAVSEASVLLALDLALAVDPSFFAPPSRSSLTRIAVKPMSAVSEFESIASKIAARSREHEGAARAIAAALQAAAPDVDSVEIPIFGSARRQRVPAIALLTPGMAPKTSEAAILLPAYSRWVVDDVDVYLPEVPTVLSARASVAEIRREHRGFRLWIGLIAFALVVTALAVVALLRTR